MSGIVNKYLLFDCKIVFAIYVKLPNGNYFRYLIFNTTSYSIKYHYM